MVFQSTTATHAFRLLFILQIARSLVSLPFRLVNVISFWWSWWNSTSKNSLLLFYRLVLPRFVCGWLKRETSLNLFGVFRLALHLVKKKIVDYFCELRRGIEAKGLSSTLESERGLASDFPLEIVPYHFQIKEKSSIICVTHHKEMKTSKWRSPFRIFFNNWLSHGMFVRMFLVNHRSNRRCYMNCALALAPWKATNFYVVSFRKVVFRCVQNNWKQQVVARLS